MDSPALGKAELVVGARMRELDLSKGKRRKNSEIQSKKLATHSAGFPPAPPRSTESARKA